MRLLRHVSQAVLESKQLQFVGAVDTADGTSGDRDRGATVRRVALELQRSWNEQFPTGRVTEIKVAASDMDYSISFDLPLGGSRAHE